jgi:hypothetical protein
MDRNNDDSILFDYTNEMLIDFFDNKKNKKYSKLPDFITFNESFTKTGKQGLLGVLDVKTDEGKKQVVYKISQYINYLVDHENSMLQGLNEIREYCPHFCKGFGKITVPVDADFRKAENPFQIDSGLKIYGDVLLMEYINPAKKLYRYLKKEDISEDIIFSLIKQTFLAVNIAQNKKEFCHYDLHSNNILINKCNKNSCFLYVLDEKHQFLVPTYGFYPKIIDFGFGYVGDMTGKPMYAPLAHTDVGFISDRFDKVADPKLFLITVSDEVVNYREDSKKGKLFRKIVKNIFKPLKVDWESGWDDVDDISASDYVINLLEDVEKKSKSKFFKRFGHYCIDLSQKLISLPIQKHKYKKIDEIYSYIIEEFRKIEKEISNDFYNLYIFKNIIDFAYEVKDDYLSENKEKREKALKNFKNNIFEVLNKVAKFVNPKIDYEKLLCSLFIFAKKMNGVLYEVMTERMSDKNKEYNKMKLQTTSEIYECLDYNIPSEYTLDNETVIYLFDCINERSLKFNLPSEIVEEINSTYPSSRGEVLYSLLKEGKINSDNVVNEMNDNELEDDLDFNEKDEDQDDEDEDQDDEDFEDEDDDVFNSEFDDEFDQDDEDQDDEKEQNNEDEDEDDESDL